MGQAEAAFGRDQQVLVGRCGIGRRRLELGPFGGLLDAQLRAAPQDVRHQAAMAGVEMLDDHDGEAEVRRQRAQNLADGGQSSSGGGHHDDVVPVGRSGTPHPDVREGVDVLVLPVDHLYPHILPGQRCEWR